MTTKPNTVPVTATQTKTTDHSYITSLPTFAERGQAIAKRLESVKADPKYQALPEDRKARVRASIYDKYVPKSYAGFHLPVPNKETWVGATGRDTAFKMPGTPDEKLSDTFKDPRNKQFGQDFKVGMARKMDGIALFGATVTNKVFSSIFGLDTNFSHKDEEYLKSILPPYKLEKSIQRNLDNYISAQRDKLQSDNFWLETHPRDTVVGKLASNAGEFIVTLPLYEAIGAIGVGATAGNLSLRLLSNKAGQFVAKRLVTATNAFMGSLVESGGSPGAGIQGAGSAVVGEMVLGSAGKAAGKAVKIAAAPLIKKWTAGVVAEGGIPFAQDVALSSMHEIEQEIANEAGIKSGSTGEELTKFKTAMEEREKYNPIMAKLHEGEKVSLGSVAMQKFGKPLKNLSQNQRKEVFAQRLELINQAAREAPVHLPEQHAQEVTSQIAQERASNPLLDSLMKRDEQMFGIKYADAVVENNIAEIAKETGISNNQGAIRKLNKVINPSSVSSALPQDIAGSKPRYGYQDKLFKLDFDDPRDLAVYTVGQKIKNKAHDKFVSYLKSQGMNYSEALEHGNKIRAYIKEKARVGDPEEAEVIKVPSMLAPTKSVGADLNAYHKVQKESYAYYRAPRNRKNLSNAIGLASAGNYNTLYEELKKADGGVFKFEKPIDRLLYHYGNRKQMPKAMSAAILRNIRKTRGFENASAHDVANQASYFHNHIYDFVMSGRASSEGNIFASTKTTGQMTKWQMQLSQESDNAVIRQAQVALARHPHALKGFNASVKAIQKSHFAAQTPDERMAYKKALANASAGIVSHVKDTELGGIIQ